MGKVDRHRNRVEPFTSLFWALGNVYYTANTGHAPPDRYHFTAVHKAYPYMVLVGSIINEDAPAPPFSYPGICYLQYSCSYICREGKINTGRSRIFRITNFYKRKKLLKIIWNLKLSSGENLYEPKVRFRFWAILTTKDLDFLNYAYLTNPSFYDLWS